MCVISNFSRNTSLFILLILFSVLSSAQKYERGVLIDNKDNVIDGNFFIDNEAFKVIKKEKSGLSEYFFSEIKSFHRDGTPHKQVVYRDNIYLVKQIVSGNASLFQLDENRYFIKKGIIIEKVYPYSEYTITTFQKLFEDCEGINTHIESQFKLDKFAMARIVNHYNHCGLPTEDYSVDDRAVLQSLNVRKDNLLFKFTTGAGVNTLTLFQDGKNMSVANFHFGTGAMYSPNFFGRLQNRLYFNVDGMYSISSERYFMTNTLGEFDIEIHALKLAFGWYMFFNTDKKVQPYAGMDLLFQRDFYKGVYQQNRFHTHIGLSHFMPTLGARYKTPGNYFSLSASYIPRYENNSSFRDANNSFVPLQVFSEQFVFIIAFYF